MKRFISAAWAAVSLASAALAVSAASAGTVTVTLTGVELRPGQVNVALATRNQFLRGGTYTAKVSPTAGATTVTFSDVAPGDYALMATHDENGNGRMDLGLMGPTEGFALSNQPGPLRGFPRFERHRFTVGSAPVTITAPMHY